ncbi:MAG: putative acylesterase/phospholipase RssA/CRP-like cAMP-binding protein [bacterium]|jgi:predicted acylesterase/phospholipase RssA/CRP-like cAMP-binding protein
MLKEARAIKQLKKLPLLQSITDELWEKLTPLISFQEVPEGCTLFTAGRQSENLYVVLDGELGLYMPFSISGETFYLQSRKKGDTAGDFAVLNGGEHLVSAIAVKKTRVAQFPRYAFDQLAEIDSGILAHVYDSAAVLSRRVTLAGSYLRLFGDISNAVMDSLLEQTEIRHYRSGQVLFEEGDPPDGLYIAVSGKLIVETTNQDGQRRKMAEVHAPETVGELALLANSNRTSTVIAARESTLALLSRAAFDEIIAPRAQLLLQLSRLVVNRHVANIREEVGNAADRNFVVIPLDVRLPLRRFVHQLKSSMRELGSSLSIDSRSFDTLYGRTGASQTGFDDVFNPAIAEWLDDKENRFESLMYVADKEWTPWTRRCVNRADRILLVANASPDNDTGIRAMERQLHDMFSQSRIRPRIDLVLLHSSDTKQPIGTAKWLDIRRLDAFYHVRLNDKLHFGRLARRMRNCARGIVFSGGGARGYAHLGVHKLIEEQNVEIDYIGGSSMGGLLGAVMAMGHSYASIEELSSTFASKRALYDYTLPLASLMTSSKLTNFCKHVYQSARIEDLWTPFFCVSSNLADGREVIHDKGPLWKVIRSTISLPGIFSPVPMSNGDLLVDGAVLNSFPVDIMLDRLGGKGNIIGVNVSHIPEQFNYYDFGTTLSGWEVLLSRLNPFAETIRIPRMVETLLRSTDIKSIERLNVARNSIQILVEPNVRSIALMDFKSYKKISELGYQEAKEVFIRNGICSSEACAKAEGSAGHGIGLENDADVSVNAATPVSGH